MAGPWEKYAGGTATAEPESGPWAKYAGSSVESPIAPPSVPRPQVNMQMNTEPVHGIPPAVPQPPATDFSGRIGERVGQNVNLIPNLIAGRGQPGGAQSAQHVAGLDHPTVLGKAAGIATIVPRLAIDTARQYAHDPAALAGDIVTASPELSEMKLPGSKQFAGARVPAPPPELALSPEQQVKYTADLDAANAKFAAKNEPFKRQQAIQQQQQVLAEDLRQKAQTVYKSQRAALDQRWDQMRAAVGEETPTPITNAIKAVDQAETKILRGAPGSVKQFKQMLNEFGFGDYDPDTGKYVGGATDAPWQTVRAQASAMSRAMASGELGNVYPALKMVRDALEDSAGRVAEAQGQGEQYRALRADEHQFRNDFENLGAVSLGKGNPAARLVRAPNASFASDAALGKAGDLLAQALARWDQTGETAASVNQMRALAAESKTLPKSSVPPKLPEVARPAPEAPKAGFLRKHVIPKLAGATAATVIPGPHYLIKYAAGEEAARAIMNRMPVRRPLPPTPEAYHRAILAAKEGTIPPGEADRQIARSGGSVKVRPPFWKRMPPPQE